MRLIAAIATMSVALLATAWADDEHCSKLEAARHVDDSHTLTALASGLINKFV